MPGTVDGIGLSMHLVLYTFRPMVKFNLYIRHKEKLTIKQKKYDNTL